MITNEQLTQLRNKMEHALGEVQDVDRLIDAEGGLVDLTELHTYTQAALGAVGELDEMVENLKNSEEQ